MAEQTIYTAGLLGPEPSHIGTSSALSGAGAPSNSLGTNGDIYVNTSTGDIYTKAGDVWIIFAASGSSNNTSGSGSPVGVVTPGAVNQFYRDTTTPGLWQATGLTNADWIQWI